MKLFPITDVVAEDVRAKSLGKRKWDASFSPLQVGKQWFYEYVGSLCRLSTKQGYETKTLRDVFSLAKNRSKTADTFDCHNVDSWVLANAIVGGHKKPDNTDVVKLVPLQFHRRQLHYFQASGGGIRPKYGGTRSAGFTRGSLVSHIKHGVCYVGGSSVRGISLHNGRNGKRLAQNAKAADIKFLSYATWRRES
jgi:hypothetical protein